VRRSTPSVTAYREGPFLVRGPITVIDEDGQELCLRRDTVALCRCGRSRTKPICDGSHAAAPARSAARLDDAD
jgi:CDGSH-type Zn-finger protein